MQRYSLGAVMLGAVCLVLFGVACPRIGPGDVSHAPSRPTDDSTITLTGTVVFMDLEGGFHGIRGDDGRSYYPLGLEERFRRDGLRVRFEARPESVITTRQWGTPVRIVSISVL